MALMGSTLSAWLNIYGIKKTTIGLFSMTTLPYALKFTWAPIIDSVKLPFLHRLGHRKSWLIFIQFLMILAIMQMAHIDPSQQVAKMAMWAVIIATLSATQDIVIDAYRVVIAEDNQGEGAAASVTGYRISMLASGGGALMLVDYLQSNQITLFGLGPWGTTYCIMATLLPIGSLASLILDNDPAPSSSTSEEDENQALDPWIKRAIINPFADFMQRPNWLLCLFLIATYKLGDAFVLSMWTPFLQDMGFSLTQIGIVVKSFGLFATIAGGIAGGTIVYKTSIRMSVLLFSFLQCITNLFYFALLYHPSISMLYVTIAIENATGAMGTSAYIAFISSLCSKKYTGTQYALLTSFAILNRVMASSGGWVAENWGWRIFFTIGVVSHIPAMITAFTVYKKHHSQAPQEQPTN